MNRLLILPVILALAGCDPDPNKIEVAKAPNAQQDAKAVESVGTRWKVTSEGYFNAGYDNNRREILRMVSPEGRVFIGVTGVGITEFRTETENDHSVTKEE